MREADAQAAQLGIPEELLMEAAGVAVAREVLERSAALGRVLLLCGTGNNGGDGFVAARHLRMTGLDVTVLRLPGLPGSEAARRALGALRAQGESSRLQLAHLDAEALEQHLPRHGLVVDALFGSGLSRPLEGELAALVEAVNASGKPVVSVDIPSGVYADSPRVPGPAILATATVQLAGAKISGAFSPAREHYGESKVVPIGIPDRVLAGLSRVELLEESRFRWPHRAAGAHKYEAGTVLVLGGLARYIGAAELACRGAYRAGAGLVTLLGPARLPASWPEIVFEEIDWAVDPAGRLEQIAPGRAQVVVAGPGLDGRAAGQLPSLLAVRPVPWVLDAGALVNDPDLKRSMTAHGRCVLTPHGGEASRLLGADGPDPAYRPLESALLLAREWNAVVVLKGPSTVIADPAGDAAVFAAGNPAMATAGTGDVLAGVIGAHLAQHRRGEISAPELRGIVQMGVLHHGLAGQRAAQRRGLGLVASDVIDALAQL